MIFISVNDILGHKKYSVNLCAVSASVVNSPRTGIRNFTTEILTA